MGNLRLHIGPKGSYYFFKNEITEHLFNNEEDKFIYIMPVNRAVRYFKKEMVLSSSKHAILDLNVFTFKSFINKLHQNYYQKKKIITSAMRLILIKEVLKSSSGQMEFFQSQWSIGKGMIVRANQMVDEFFQFGYSPGDFNQPPVSAENKYRDFGQLITLLFSRYDNRLLDESTLINQVIHQLKVDQIQALYPNLQKIYISGFGIFSPPMIQFLRIMRNRYDIELKLEFDKKNLALFQHTADAFEVLEQFADEIIYHAGDDNGISSRLFKSLNEKPGKTGIPGNIIIQKTRSRSEEVRLIASRIKSLSIRKSVKLNRIGITFPEIETYAPLIKSVFHEFEIPFNLSTGFALDRSALIQSYLLVLKIAAYGPDLDNVLKLMSSPFLEKTYDDDVRFLSQTAKKCNIKFISGDWQDRILQLFQDKNTHILSLGTYGGQHLADIKERLVRINSLCEIIRTFSPDQSVHYIHDSYLKILKSLGLRNWYERENSYLSVREKEKEFRAFNRFIKLLDEVRWILNYMNGEASISLQEYYQYIELVVENTTYNLREWSDFGVQIMPRLEILSLDLDYFFIGGMIEGEFPKLFTRDVFFNDDERHQMGLNASEDRLQQDRFLFYQWLSSGAETITFSYPMTEKDQTLQMSTFLTALEGGADNIKQPDLPDYEDTISRKSVLEYLSQSLSSEISDKQINLYSNLGSKHINLPLLQWQNNIRIHIKRSSFKLVTEFEGNLQSGGLETWMQEKHLKKPFSITSLESYAFCPMQYFLRRVIGLKEEEEPTVTMNPLERGNALHKILYNFYMRLGSDQKKHPWDYLDILENEASKIFSDMPYTDIVWAMDKEKFFGQGINPGLWQRFLEAEKVAQEESGFRPALFELKFNNFPKEVPGEKQLEGLVISRSEGDILINGVIDRIDIDEKGRIVVIDYKTGNTATKINLAQILEGLSLQLPVYLAAAKALYPLLEQSVEAVAGIYYQIKDSENCRRVFVLADGAKTEDLNLPKRVRLPLQKKSEEEDPLSFQQVVDKTMNTIVTYVNRMAAGDFTHTKDPKNERCQTYCGYRRICRKNVTKLISMQE
jgi:ATP-dependent helicase/DNAse subunit B